jgi:hypothetical protein
MISKLSIAFVAFLLCVAAAITVNAQTPAPSKGNAEKVRERKPAEAKPVDKLGDKAAAKKAATWFPRISEVHVTPGSRSAILSFKSALKNVAVIEIATTVPATDSNGNLSFSPQAGAFSRFVSLENGGYKLDLEELEAKTTYYYIINVFDGNKQRYQDRGSFTTTPQKVTAKVIFTDLRLFPQALNLVSLYKAKYVFFFDVNVDYPALSGDCFCRADWFYHVPGRSLLGPVKEYYSNSQGTYYEPEAVELPKGKITLKGQEVVIENPPDDLLIVVQGLQDADQPPRNSNSTQSYTTFAQVVAVTGSTRPGSSPRGTPAAYYNVARGSFHLSASPGDTASISFTLPSQHLTPGHIDGYLSFEISGRIEITRQ